MVVVGFKGAYRYGLSNQDNPSLFRLHETLITNIIYQDPFALILPKSI